MNTYTVKAKKAIEHGLVEMIRAFEHENCAEVSAINFKRQSICDTEGQKIRTWDIELSCKNKNDEPF